MCIVEFSQYTYFASCNILCLYMPYLYISYLRIYRCVCSYRCSSDVGGSHGRSHSTELELQDTQGNRHLFVHRYIRMYLYVIHARYSRVPLCLLYYNLYLMIYTPICMCVDQRVQAPSRRRCSTRLLGPSRSIHTLPQAMAPQACLYLRQWGCW